MSRPELASARATAANVLPSSLPPRGLSREQAAAYVGLGTTKFDQLVADNRMPKPKRVDGRVIWDRLQLDAAFAALPDENGRAHESDDVWSNCAV